jgi:hypothetical protein
VKVAVSNDFVRHSNVPFVSYLPPFANNATWMNKMLLYVLVLLSHHCYDM